jgi:hypothetical protein
MKMRVIIALGLSMSVGLAIQPAVAQYDPVSVGNWQLSSTITYVGGLVIQDQQRVNGSVKRDVNWQPQAQSGNNAQTKTANVILSYKPSLSRRRANINNFIAANRRVNPALGAELEQVFATNDVMTELSKELAVYGLRIDNVADAFTVYWINAWEAANGLGKSKTDKAIALNVKRQVEQLMRQSPRFVAATEAQRQEMSETWLIQAALLAPLGKMAADDSSLAKVIAKNIRKSALASGLDLDAMTLTKDGFVPAKPR